MRLLCPCLDPKPYTQIPKSEISHHPETLSPRGEGGGLESAETPKREFLIDNLLVQIYLIIEMTLVDRPCAMGV